MKSMIKNYPRNMFLEVIKMKGIILAGGTGTRLFPLTKVTNKHLLPVGKEPMIYNPIKNLVKSGIEEIMVVTSKEHMGDVVNLLGSGNEFGCDFTYKVQETPGGIAHALALTENFAKNDKIVVLLADNIFKESISKYIKKFEEQIKGARVLLVKVDEPRKYGIAAMDEKKIISVEEKPEHPISPYAVVGCYMYDNTVFDKIKKINPSSRGELEITSVNNLYIKESTLEYDLYEGFWTDAGTFRSYLHANQVMMRIDKPKNKTSS